MTITAEQIRTLADTYKLLGDHTRLKIMLTCLDGEISVGDIANKLNISQSLVSHNLRHLKAARLIIGERRNKQIFYTAADGHVSHMLYDMLEHIQEDN